MSARRRHNKSNRYNKDDKADRKWMRRALRRIAKALIGKRKSAAIEPERKSRGWETW